MTYSTRLTLKASHRKLGLWLAFVAGAINAAGLVFFGVFTSHMTGQASFIGTRLAFGQIKVISAFIMLICFVIGAAITSIIVNFRRDRKAGDEYSVVLLLEFSLVFIFIAITYLWQKFGYINAFNTIYLLCFIMGLQNALITKISDAIIRTTHVTGLATDLGIELGRALYKRVSGNMQMQLRPDKARLFAWLLCSFILGGIAGAFGVVHFGAISLLPLCAILLWLSSNIHRKEAA